MSVSGKGKFWVIAAGAAALVGGALMYHFFTSDEDDEFAPIKAELEEFGEL